MKSLNLTTIALPLIAAIVGAGYWYANFVTNEALPHPASASGTAIRGVSSVDWSTDGERLFSLSRGGANFRGTLIVHDLSEPGGWQRLDPQPEIITMAQLSPNSRHALVSLGNGALLWIDLRSSESATLADSVSLPETHFTCMAISSDSRLVAAGDRAGRIHVFDLKRGTSAELLAGLAPASCVNDLRFSSDGKWLLSAHDSGTIVILDAHTGNRLVELTGHLGAVIAAWFSRDGARVISGSEDGSIRIWDVATGREIRRMMSGLGPVRALTVTRDGSSAAWVGFGHNIVIWDLERDQKRCEIVSPAQMMSHLRFSPDGRALAVAGLRAAILIYDAETGAEQRVIDDGMPED